RRRGSLGNPDGALAINEVRAPAREAWSLENRLDRRKWREVEWQGVVSPRFRPPELLHLLCPFGHRLGEIGALGEVFGQVVQLPIEAFRRNAFRLRLPGEDERRGRGHPAIVIDAAIAEHL